ncbi:hypothetical protein HNY73_017138 [Argiope bruennichi]|uniref:Uncharacterized protein n=1 Tax=Argiope bruennichi TaxID=94029 RepID=A0A8T0EPM2_ARGBR|nr:hypothetical protein HNY73_017138 [Argiope bruennichi]
MESFSRGEFARILPYDSILTIYVNEQTYRKSPPLPESYRRKGNKGPIYCLLNYGVHLIAQTEELASLTSFKTSKMNVSIHSMSTLPALDDLQSKARLSGNLTLDLRPQRQTSTPHVVTHSNISRSRGAHMDCSRIAQQYSNAADSSPISPLTALCTNRCPPHPYLGGNGPSEAGSVSYSPPSFYPPSPSGQVFSFGIPGHHQTSALTT